MTTPCYSGNLKTNCGWLKASVHQPAVWSTDPRKKGFHIKKKESTWHDLPQQRRLRGYVPRLRLIWADGSYTAKLVETVKILFHWTLEIVKRSDTGFMVLPKRWIVERTFSWLYRYRRLSKDYEQLPENSEAMILIAMINLMSRRLAHGYATQRF